MAENLWSYFYLKKVLNKTLVQKDIVNKCFAMQYKFNNKIVMLI